MDRDAVRAWVAGYERAWRADDLDALEDLFTPDVRYRRSPYDEGIVGLTALGAFWPEDEDGRDFVVTAEPVAVEDAHAVVRLQVDYRGAKPQEYRDLWVLHFAADGRVDDFEEWPYWPEKPYIAD